MFTNSPGTRSSEFDNSGAPWVGGVGQRGIDDHSKELRDKLDMSKEYNVYTYDALGNMYAGPRVLSGSAIVSLVASRAMHLFKVTTLNGVDVCRCSFVTASVAHRVSHIH